MLSTYVGAAGAPGRGKGRHGHNAEPTYIDVPLGTLVKHEGEVRLIMSLAI